LNKRDLQYFVDAVLFIAVCSVSVIGLLLGFVIPKGRAQESMKYFLGLHRHEWGSIHLFLSVSLLLLLCIHVGLHWTWVVQTTRRHFGDKWKRALWMLSGAWIVVLLIGWVVAKL